MTSNPVDSDNPMSKPPELNYRPLSDGRYEVWLHAVVTQDALLGLHGVLAQYGAEGPPEPEEADEPEATEDTGSDDGGGRTH
jgi:hypothetical protein